MKNNKLIIYILFMIVLSFAFISEYSAATPSYTDKTTRCEYVHSSYPNCKLVMIRYAKDDWRAEANHSSQACATVTEGEYKQAVKALVPNSKDFYEKYMKRYTNEKCPSLYIGVNLQKCSGKKVENASYSSLDKCFVVYNSSGGYNRLKIQGEYYSETGAEHSVRVAEEKENADPNKKHFKEALESLTKLQSESDIEHCEQLLSDEVLDIIKKALLIIRIAVPIILITLSMLDFAKAIPSNNNDAVQKAISVSVKRFIAVILVFLVPTLIMFVMNLLGITDGTCGL